ncbi:MAG: hypothetical protein ABFS18_14030 [Thermodesulfobacteriota bacterium]
MKKIIGFIMFFLVLEVLAIRYRAEIATALNLQYTTDFKSAFFTVWSSVLGSLFYLLRAIYENKCVYKRWDEDWEVWYYIRPFTGAIIGIAVWLAFKAGVFLLSQEAKLVNIWSSCFIGFIAGMNVKNMQSLIEKIAKKKTGIEESNQTKSG